MSALSRRLGAGALCLAAASGWLGCAGPGQYVWFDELPRDVQFSDSEYIIGVGDIVSIRVLGHEEMTIKEPVRADGRIALLLIGEVTAKGKRPSALGAELQGRLKDYIVSPSVAVNVEQTAPVTIPVLGEVVKPGSYPVGEDAGLAHMLALAGGLTDYASRSSIFVVRAEPRPERIRFTFEDISRDIRGASEFPLHRGDLVEVE